MGNNNWAHAAETKYKLWSYVYYSVIESEDHYFIHYAVFHPQPEIAALMAERLHEHVHQLLDHPHS